METATYWQRVEELFHAALRQPPGARAQFLAAACGQEEALRAQVAALLAAHETDDGQPLEASINALAEEWLAPTGGASLAGRSIRQYQILAPLGRGGMGEVYLAYDDKLCRQVALKRLLDQQVCQPQARKRFIREAQAAAQLDHPNVCTIYEVIEEDAECFIVMQYVAGETLAARIQRAQLTIAEALACAAQIAAALAAAHQAGIVHRDIKPHNIMLGAQGQVKVLDFGIAKLSGQAEATVARSNITTTPALILGTPNYMSPEQARGETVDARSDLFCLGVVLYEMLTGQAPFDAPSASEVLANLLKTEPLPLKAYRPEAPAELEAVLRKALAKQPAARYQSAQELQADLQGLPEPTLRKNRLKRAVAAQLRAGLPRFTRGRRVVVASLLLLTLAAVLWGSKRKPGQSAILDSIAVLPFERAGSAAEHAYLADGLTEELINDLTNVPDLRVAPRSAVFNYRNRPLDLRQVGERLQVKALLTGRVTVRDGRFELQAELIEVAREAQLWGQRFSRPSAELQSLRQELLGALVKQLRATAPVIALGPLRQTSPAAYDEYLQGLHQLRLRLRRESGFSKQRALEYFQRALALDRRYAPAWAGLAAIYTTLIQDGNLTTAEGVPKVKEAALQALALDNALPDAHLALAENYLYCEWKFADAERAYLRYRELNPHDALAHQSYARFLYIQKRFAEATQALQQARRLEPYSYANDNLEGGVLYRTRRFAELVEHGQRMLRLHPKEIGGKNFLVSGYLGQGDYEQALQRRKEVLSQVDYLYARFNLAHIYAAAGRRAEAQRALARAEADLRTKGLPGYRYNYDKAFIPAALGESAAALALLEESFRQRETKLVLLYTEPAFDKLRADPRFTDLLRRIGFTP